MLINLDLFLNKMYPTTENNPVLEMADATVCFSDLFDVEELQRMQDLFAQANGVASLITFPDGTPITQPSHDCRFCSNIAREAINGEAKKVRLDILLDQHDVVCPVYKTCARAGLWDASTPIAVNGNHLATWLIGQIDGPTLGAANGTGDLHTLKFRKIAEMLSVFANQLSEKAYNNLQLKNIIAEKERLNEQLRKSEERYRLILNASPDNISITDLQGRFLMLSQGALKMFGFKSPEKVIGKSIIDFIIPEERERVIEDIGLMFQGLKIGPAEYRAIHPDGRIIEIEVNSEFLRDQDGTPYNMIHIVRDIGIRKEAEKKILANEAKYGKMMANIGDVIAIMDKDGIARYKSPNVEKWFGWKPEELVGNIAWQYIHPGDQEMVLKSFDEFIKQPNSTTTIEFRYRCKDGAYKWISFTGNNLIHDPHIQGILGNYHDISKRKAIETALRKSEEKYRLIFENSPVGVLSFDGHGEIVACNDSFARIIGSPKEILIGLDMLSLPDEKVVMEIKKSLQGETGHFEGYYHSFTSDKVTIIRALFAPIIMEDCSVCGAVGIIEDISERIKAVVELKKAREKAEESDRLKTAFLSNMSHEIRTPMNGILGFSDLLKNPKLTGKEQQEYISIIEKSGERMLNIINDIIDISRIEAGHMEVLITETNIAELLQFISKFFQPEARLKRIKLYSPNLTTDEALIVNTDKQKLNAILINLVKNAIKFTSNGLIEFGYRKTENDLLFYVKDTGRGIPESKKSIIFERFRQGNEQSNRDYEGAGLGLAISKAYAEMLGGRIWVESEPEKGSVFSFTIPLNKEHEEKIDLVSDRDENEIEINIMKNLKILIAEDDEVTEMLIGKVAGSFGKEIINVRKGTDAIEACRKNPDIDLILMDIKMPGLDGYEATRQIRKFNEEVIIIAQTAYALSGDREQAQLAGCNEYISKPINLALLTELLRKYSLKKEIRLGAQS